MSVLLNWRVVGFIATSERVVSKQTNMNTVIIVFMRITCNSTIETIEKECYVIDGMQ